MRRRGICLVPASPSCYPEIASPAGLVSDFRSTPPFMKLDRQVIRLYAAMIVALVGLFAPASARAQFQPRPVSDPATGERFHIEGSIGLWFPGTEMQISSSALAIVGSTIDFKTDLGLEDQTFPEFHLVAKGGGSKFRFSFIPLKYEQSATLHRTLVFNGQALCRRTAGQLPAGLEGVPHRLRVRLHPPGPRFRRVHPGRQVHRRERVARQPDSIGLRQRAGPDPDDRRHLPGLPRPEHRHHRRDHGIHTRAGLQTRSGARRTATTRTSTSTAR